MPNTYTEQGILTRLNTMPDGIKLGSLSKGNFGSIVANVFHNTTKVPNSSYNQSDRQMVTGAEAYAYRPEVIRDTLLVMTVGQRAWLTQRLSPVQILPETAKVLVWQVTKFKQSLATQVPHLGISRQSRHERIKVQAAVKRIGKMYTMEHDFMNTREGLRYHLAQLEQMANSMRDTIYYDILHTVVNAHEWERNFIRNRKLFNDLSADEYFREQIWAFAILQKQENAFPIMAANIEERMTYWGGEADVFIIPPQIMRYVNLVPTENTEFMKAGPVGQQRLYDSLKPYSVSGVNDVFVARSYFQDEMMGARQLLEDTKEFGEFYPMRTPDYDPDVPYRTKHMHIMVYSYIRDSLVELKAKKMLNHCHLFTETGDPLYLNKIPDFYEPFAEPEHMGKDLWNYADSNGKAQEVVFFGQMEARYFTVEDKEHMAHTVINAMRSQLRDSACDDMLCAFNDGIDLLRRIQSIGASPGVLTDMFALASASGIDEPASTASLSTTIGLPEFRQDPSTGFLSAAPIGGTFNALLPGLQSEAGFRYLIRYGGANLADEKKKAARFLEAVGSIASYLEDFFPGNLALHPEFVSSVWQFPSLTSNLVDNLLLGGYNPPIFIRSGVDGSNLTNLLTRMVAELPVNSPFTFSVSDTVAQGGGATREQLVSLYVIIALLKVASAAFASGSLDQAAADGINAVLGRSAAAPFTITLVDSNQITALMANLYAVPGTGAAFGRLDTVEARQALAEPLLEQAGAVLANGERGAYFRSPFLASYAFAESLSRNPDDRFRIGDPTQPSVPVEPVDALPMIVGKNAPSDVPLVSSLMSTVLAATQLEMHNNGVGMDISAAPDYAYPQESAAVSAARYYSQGRNPIVAVPQGNLAIFSETARAAIADGVALFTNTLQASWSAIDANTPNPLLRAIMHVYDLTPVSRMAYEKWFKNNILSNIDFYITRPHIQVSALDVIKVKAGSDTMITGVAPGQFELGDDPNVQGHLGTMTSKHAILMMKPENVCNQKGAMINGVLGGLNTVPIDPAKYDMGLGNFDGQDMIVIPVARRDHFEGNVLSLTGSLRTAETRALSLKTEAKESQYDTHPRMNKIFGFRQNRSGVNTEASVVAALQDEYSNVICLAGTHVTVEPRTSKFKYAVQGDSYLSGLISPKCGQLLSGKMVKRPDNAWKGYTEL